jgi:hypothetical protein
MIEPIAAFLDRWEARHLPAAQRRYYCETSRLKREVSRGRLTEHERFAAEMDLIPARFLANEAQRAELKQMALDGRGYCYLHGWDDWFIWMDDQRYELRPGGELRRI